MAILQRNICQDELKSIHKAIVKVLSEKGMKLGYDRALEVFAKHGAKVEGDIVFISEELLMKALSTVPKQFVIKGREEKYDVEIGTGKTAFCPAYGPVFVSRYGERRNGIKDDLIAFSKLTQSSKVLDLMNPYVLTPTDVEDEKLLMCQQAACLKYGAKPNMVISAGYEITKSCIDLVKQINGHGVEDEMVCAGNISALSPLAYDETMLGSIFALAEAKQPLILSCMGMLGASSVMSSMSMLVTTMAESLTGVVLAQLISPGVPCVTGNVSSGSDMRYITPTIGSAEYCKNEIYAKAVSDFYGIPCRGGGAVCDANETDYEAGSESALTLFSGLAAGQDMVIHAVGILDSFNIIGYEKFALDEQLIEISQHVLKNEKVDAESIAHEVIMEIPHAGQYIMHEHTYENMHTAQYNPALSHRGYYDTWESNGSQSLLEQVNIAIDERLNAFTMPKLSEEKANILDSYLN